MRRGTPGRRPATGSGCISAARGRGMRASRICCTKDASRCQAMRFSSRETRSRIVGATSRFRGYFEMKTALAFSVVFVSAVLALGSRSAVPAAPQGAVGPSGLKQDTIVVKDQRRSYLLYVPRSVKPNAPLLFVLHPSGGDG